MQHIDRLAAAVEAKWLAGLNWFGFNTGMGRDGASDPNNSSDDVAPLDKLEDLIRAQSGRRHPPAPAPATQPSADAAMETYDLVDDDLLTPIETAAKARRDESLPGSIDYAPAKVTLSGFWRKRTRFDAVRGPSRTYWQDILFAWKYPFASEHNRVQFMAVLVIGGVGGAVLCISRFVYVWLSAVCVNVIIDTASGSDQFPSAYTDSGWWDGYGAPALAEMVSVLLSIMPLLVYRLLVHWGWILPSAVLEWMWLGIGIFLWPMILLLVSLESPSFLYRVDLIILTIARTLGPYVVVWLAVLAPLALTYVSIQGIVVFEGTLTSRSTPQQVLTWFALFVLQQMVGIYLMIVASRCIGLYYLHFKKRFAFRLE